MLDASGSSAAHTLMKGQAQYLTPASFAEMCQSKLPSPHQQITVFDPQVGRGALLRPFKQRLPFSLRFGVEIDRNCSVPDEQAFIYNANCVEWWTVLDELYPQLTFRVQVANPPFGLIWATPEGKADSTLYTWQNMLKRAGALGCGYMIANASTIERLGLHQEPRVYRYEKFERVFDAEVTVGVLWFYGSNRKGASPAHFYIGGSDGQEVAIAMRNVAAVIAEEKRKRPPFNIYLDQHGYLRTYLSLRESLGSRLKKRDIEQLAKANKCHPLTLTTERDTRLLLAELAEGVGGEFTIQPEAKAAIDEALRQRKEISVPIMDVTDFECVAYADDAEALVAKAPHPKIRLTPGQKYRTTTGTYKFSSSYQKMRLHLQAGQTYSAVHDMLLSGQDRFISIKDDVGICHRFLDKVSASQFEHSDAILWDLFEKPHIDTVATLYPELVAQNRAVMEACEMLAGFEYYPGQREFYARVAVRDYALVAAATGTGKTLGAITLVVLKAPKRALIIAPQGTTRAKKDDDEDAIEDMAASQWISELRRFAPGLQVFELFSVQDYERIKLLNDGVLPNGVYVSYYEAMFQNKARETVKPGSKFDDRKFAQQFGIKIPAPPPGEAARPTHEWTASIGQERMGIRCIAQPCLSTLVSHEFDLIALDEAHKMCHLSSNLTQMVIRMQPRYRYALTATPIPNIASDIFPLMGWLCVPGWYKGGVRNAAWPYAREEHGKFARTFLSIERDLTQEEMNKIADPKNRRAVTKISPTISSPARLLKIIKPTVAFISKEACNPNKPKATVHDVRVSMGAGQAKVYEWFMNRAHVPHDDPLVAASMQITILRDLCAAPASSKYNRLMREPVRSNFNPKTAAILSIVGDVLARRQQVVIVAARLSQSDYIESRLQQAGIATARIDSSMPPDKHTGQAQLFKSGRVPVLIMGIKCAQAHSFEQCPNLIISSLEYSWGAFDQACGRIDRVSSKLPMNVYCVLTQNSIEEIMFDVVATKGDAATICLRGERVPRSFVTTDLADIMARNFDAFDVHVKRPTEATTEAAWPEICERLRQAHADHPCHLARNS